MWHDADDGGMMGFSANDDVSVLYVPHPRILLTTVSESTVRVEVPDLFESFMHTHTYRSPPLAAAPQRMQYDRHDRRLARCSLEATATVLILLWAAGGSSARS